MTILPAFVPRRNCKTADVALSSRKSSLTVGARGCFHSQVFPTFFRNPLI